MLLSLFLVSSASISRAGSEDSPFGFLPEIVVPPYEYSIDNPYVYAVDLGVRWHRTTAGFIWPLVQPDLSREFDWSSMDRVIADLPEGMRILANIQIGDNDNGHPVGVGRYNRGGARV